jgi:hypothetical protein
MKNETINFTTDLGAMSVDQFCVWASIGKTKFYEEVQRGNIVVRKIGRKSIVASTDAQSWLNSLPTVGGGR